MILSASRLFVLGLAAFMTASCGAIGSTTNTTPTSEPSYSNPASGPLPTFDSIDAATRAVASDCTWRDLPSSSSVGQTRFCDSQYLLVLTTPNKAVDTVESIEFGSFQDDKKIACDFWAAIAVVAFNPLRREGKIPATFSGSPAPRQASAIVYGGNWMAAAPTVAAGQRIAAATSSYLLTAPRDCPSPSD